MRKFTLFLFNLVVLTLFSTNAFAGSTKYGKVVVKTTGHGLVYVNEYNEVKDEDYATEAFADDEGSAIGNFSATFYRFAKPDEGYKFVGWYTDEECTKGESTSSSVTISASSQDKENPTTVTYWAKFVEDKWDGTITTSMDNKTVTQLSDLDNMNIYINGAKSIEVKEEEAMLALGNEDGSELYGIWAPAYGSTYEINGEKVTLGGFMTMKDATIAIPAGTTKLYIEDFGAFIIDGDEEAYIPTIELNAEIAAAPEPFTYTVSNNGVVGNAQMPVECSELGVSKQFDITVADKTLSKGEATATLTLMETSDTFGEATVTATETGATISFGAANEYLTQIGTYILNLPEGVLVDADGNPNAAAAFRFVVIEGSPAAINGVGASSDAKSIYTIDGARVSAPMKGINIIGGKKVVIK